MNKYIVAIGVCLGIMLSSIHLNATELAGAGVQIRLDSVSANTTVSDNDIDADDLYWLSHLIGSESGANWCSEEMMYGVGSVVLNRVKSDKYPNTILSVIKQRGQYSVWSSGSIKREPSSRCVEIAKSLLKHGTSYPDNVVFQANGRQGKGVYLKIQNMYFCHD